MSIRRAQPTDREHLLIVWERSVRATHHFLTESDITGLRPLVADELASATIDWWVIEADHIVVGFLGFANDAIEALFVDPGHHGRGAGTALVEHAQQLTASPLTVDVNEQNGAAVKFYEARGFVVVRRSPTDGGGRPFPLLHMKRAASPPRS
jgi:putative acetyltransferase